MPFNLLLFPLAGGYYIFVRFYYFQYIQHRSDRQRLIFNSIIAGLFLLILTYTIRVITEYYFPDLIRSIWLKLPIKEAYFGTSLASFLIALVVTEVTNKFLDRDDLIIKAIKKEGNELELLIERSVDIGSFIHFTLKNDKVYVGFITELPIPSKSTHVRIIPVLSGYRDEEKQIIFNTEYLEVYAQYVRDGRITDIEDLNSDIIIVIDEILTANLFDPEMFDKFNNPGVDDENTLN